MNINPPYTLNYVGGIIKADKEIEHEIPFIHSLIHLLTQTVP